jgi:class 3 adenylate cyclase
MTKGSGTMLFISEATRDRLREHHDLLERVGDVEVRGRTSMLTVWTLAEARIPAPSEEQESHAVTP